MRAVLALAVLASAACGGTEPQRPRAVPSDAAERQRALASAGAVLHDALVKGRPASLVADDVALRSLVAPEPATRYSALRAGLGARLAGADFEMLQGTRFSGVCLQGARAERAHGTLGLVSDGWVFDRALVVGDQGGRRVAAWVEGSFVFTDRGVVALDLVRAESPRWEHADLEIAPCDMEVGVHTPLPIVDVTP